MHAARRCERNPRPFPRATRGAFACRDRFWQSWEESELCERIFGSDTACALLQLAACWTHANTSEHAFKDLCGASAQLSTRSTRSLWVRSARPSHILKRRAADFALFQANTAQLSSQEDRVRASCRAATRRRVNCER